MTVLALPARFGAWTLDQPATPHPHALHHWTITGPDCAGLPVTGGGYWDALSWLRDTYGLEYYTLLSNVVPGQPMTVHVVVGHPDREPVRMDIGCAPTCHHGEPT
jgi:hypothetical protein